MSGKPFLDTNVLLYAFATDDARAGIAKRIVSSGGWISVQVANEFIDVSRRKRRWDWERIEAALETVRDLLGAPLPITDAIHRAAIDIGRRHQFRIYDSLIIATARAAGCSVIYSEDLQDSQSVDGVLIRNPFLP